MKRIIRYIPVLLLMPLLLASCAGEKIRTKQESGKPGVVRFSLTSSLRAMGDENILHPTPALDREKSVEKLYAVVYRTSSGLHYKTVECTKTTGDNYEFDNEKSGDFYFFLVANPDADLITSLEAGPSTPEDLGELVAKQTPGEDNAATNFLMTSDRVNVKVKSKQSTTIPNSIKLIRVAARFDFYNKIEGLVINKITFNKRYTTSHLFAQVKQMDGLTSTTDKTYDGALFQGGALTGTIYGYETDTRGETYFTIEATYKGEPLNPEVVRLENFVIKRNHLYNIILHELGGAVDPNNPGSEFGKLKYEIKVADWEEGEEFVVDESEVKMALRVDYDAELANAPYMTPYLKNSQKNIYTTTKDATVVTFKLYTYLRDGSLSFAEGYTPENGVALSKVNTEKEQNTGRITQTYKLTLPKRDNFVAYNKFDASNVLVAPEFYEIPLVAKNFSGMTTKEFTVKHGRPKMPLEYLSKTPLNKAGDDFATVGNKVSEIGYFTQKGDAIPRFKECDIKGKKYHMPLVYQELTSIVTSGNRFGNDKSAIHQYTPIFSEYVVFPCWVKAGVNKRNYISELKTECLNNHDLGRGYALRFKNEEKFGLGNLLAMAYRYEWVGDFAFVGEAGNEVVSYFKITSRYLGPNWNGSVRDLQNEDFWRNDNANDAVRTIYPMGEIDLYYNTGDPTRDRKIGIAALILTSQFSGEEDVYAKAAWLTAQSLSSSKLKMANRKNLPSIAFPIWLFSNE